MSRILSIFIVIQFLFGCSENIERKTVDELKLEVMTKDLGEMNWQDAKTACKDLGDGWRLPTSDELQGLFKYRNSIGGFKKSQYWSSTVQRRPVSIGFFDYGTVVFDNSKENTHYVRAVRDIE